MLYVSLRVLKVFSGFLESSIKKNIAPMKLSLKEIRLDLHVRNKRNDKALTCQAFVINISNAISDF